MKDRSSYSKLVLMGALHFPIMYAIMYSMVATSADIFNNVNTLYMAAMMVAPMLILMPILMSKMYPMKKINFLVYACSIAILIISFVFIRGQTAVGDRQFLRSMIPHHSGAILMCKRSNIRDDEVKDLCRQIISSQQREIDQMKAIMRRLDSQ